MTNPNGPKALALALALALSGNTAFADEETRTRLLNTLDNLEATAAGMELGEAFQARIDKARIDVMNATAAELDVPGEVRSDFGVLEMTTGNLRLKFDPELRTGPRKVGAELGDMTIQSAGGDPAYNGDALAEPSYPTVNWTFSASADDPGEGPGDEEDESETESGICTFPGTAANPRFVALNAAIALEAVKDTAEQFCNQSGLGFNASVACVVTDIAFFVVKGINENQELCNDFMGAAEITATWNGVNEVHENVQHLHGDIEDLDSDIADLDSDVVNLAAQLTSHDNDIKAAVSLHDADIKSAVSTHDADVKALLNQALQNQAVMMGDLDTIIQLLKTPSGKRPGWND